MGAEPGGDEVEGGVLEGQALGAGLGGFDVGEAFVAGGPGDGGQHFGGEIAGHHLLKMGREPVGHVAAAAAQVQRARAAVGGGDGRKRFEVRALGVDRALDIGRCARAELGAGDGVVGLGHGRAPRIECQVA
jgi:hypothetical protein